MGQGGRLGIVLPPPSLPLLSLSPFLPPPLPLPLPLTLYTCGSSHSGTEPKAAAAKQ